MDTIQTGHEDIYEKAHHAPKTVFEMELQEEIEMLAAWDKMKSTKAEYRPLKCELCGMALLND